jgi:hypothetical protein
LESYESLRHRRAWTKTKAYWTAHQVLAFCSPGIAGLAIAVIIRAFWPTFKSFGGMSTALLALLCVVLGYIVSVLGSYVINYIWDAPAALHDEQRKEIADQATTIQEQSRLVEREVIGHRFLKEIPRGETNGINRDFALTYAPYPASSLDVWLNGVEQTNYYRLNGRIITFRFAPKPADQISAKYTY